MKKGGFSDNEKKVIEMLLKDSRVTDSEISSKIGISSQAVGKIRKKLEREIIKSYNVNLSFSKLGICAFAAGLARLTSAGKRKGEIEIEERLKKIENIVGAFRLPNSKFDYLIIYGFRDISDQDNFFRGNKFQKSLGGLIEHEEIFNFSQHSFLKLDFKDLFLKIIYGKSTKASSEKIGKFKKRVGEENGRKRETFSK